MLERTRTLGPLVKTVKFDACGELSLDKNSLLAQIKILEEPELVHSCGLAG